MTKDMWNAFWHFTKTEIGVAVYRFFMPIRVVAQEMYRIVHESDAPPPGSRSPDRGKRPQHG